MVGGGKRDERPCRRCHDNSGRPIIGPAAFGLAALAWLFGSLAEVLVTTPLVDPLIQRRRLDPPVVDTAFTVMLATGVLLYLLILAAAPLLAWLYAEPELTGLLAVQGTTCLLTAVRGVPEALLARELRFRALAIRGIIAKVAGALVAIGAAWLHAGAWSVILGNVAFAAAATATIASIAPRWPRLAWLPQHARSLWSFGVFSVLDAFLWMATIRLFSVLAGYFHGTRALGELNFAIRINDTLCAFMLAVTTRLALPIFSRVAQDPRQLEKVFLEGTRVAFLLVAPAFLGLAFVSQEIISLALGPGWPFAAPSLVAACLFSLLNFSCVLGHSTVKAAGKPSLLIFPNLVGLAYILVGTVAVGHFRFEALLAVWTSWGVVFVVCSLRMVHQGHRNRLAEAAAAAGALGRALAADVRGALRDHAGPPGGAGGYAVAQAGAGRTDLPAGGGRAREAAGDADHQGDRANRPLTWQPWRPTVTSWTARCAGSPCCAARRPAGGAGQWRPSRRR